VRFGLLLPFVLVPGCLSVLLLLLLRTGNGASPAVWLLVVLAPVLVGISLGLGVVHALRRMDADRRQSEEELRLSTQRFSSVVVSAMDAIITLDESLRIVVFNHAAETTFGCPAWEALGRPLDRFLPESVRGHHAQYIRRFGSSGNTTRSMNALGILTARRVNGEEFPIEATISQVQVGGQKLYTVILRDITERKRAEKTLMESEARFRSIYEQAGVGIEQVGLDGQLLMANAALCNMLGYEESELLEKNVAEIVHEDDYRREQKAVEEMLRGERPFYESEKRYRHRDGSLVWVRCTTSMVCGQTGEPQYRISVIQNVSERMRVEEQLRQSQKMEAIGRLAGGVAHDFNTLLNVMLGYSELLLAEFPESDPRREKVLQIKQSGEAGAMLTRQLLAFSRRQAVAEEVLDLRDVASKMTPILQRLLRDDVELKVTCCQEACPVKVDPGQIQQVVLNLVANAADALPSGGRIHLEVSAVEVEESLVVEHPLLEPGNYALLNISDTGVGMDAETLAHIFEPFYTTKEAGKGTGLGLATVYGIVKRNGGEIFVYSEPGEGTVFKVILPFTYELRQVAQPAQEIAPASATTEETILLVEDSAALRELTRVILARAGYRTLEADDGAVALEMARDYAGPIHLLLTDVVMPRMRGPQLAEELAKLRPGIGVVFLSGYTEEVLSESENMQGFTLVEKPYTAPILLQAIRRTLDACRHHEREKTRQQQHL